MISWAGKPVADHLYEEISTRVKRLGEYGRIPGLGIILVGNDPASDTYVRMKGKACAKYGLHSETVRLSEDATEDEVAEAILSMNNDPFIDGFIVQLPLPKHLPERQLLDLIDPKKDADCLTADNIGRMVIGTPRFLPCTPAGIISLLEYYQAPVKGKHVVIVGRSQIVGRPISLMLSQKGVDATVTVAHSRSEGLAYLLEDADGVIAAIGVPEFIDPSFCKPGAWIIDVGINRVPATNEKGYILVGDVSTKNSNHLMALTPVPGGVGVLTIAELLSNALTAAESKLGIELQ